MVLHRKHSTTRLPQSLREEIQARDDNEKSTRKSKRRPAHSLSRKEARKQGRAEQKQKKAQFFSTGKKRYAEDDEQVSSSSQPQKKTRTDDPVVPDAKIEGQPSSKKTRTTSSFAQHQNFDAAKAKEREQGGQNKPGQQMNPMEKRKTQGVPIEPPRARVEEKEDAYIAYLEKQLGYGKRGKKSSRQEDGLDDLLDWADSLMPSSNILAIDHEQDDEVEGGSGFDSISDSIVEHDEDGESEEGEDADEEEEWGGIVSSTIAQSNVPEQESPRPTSISLTASAARYIPPHLRNQEDEQESEAITKLKKQLKGLLNRMSEQNLASIIDSVEELYRNNRRHDVTSGITNLVIQGISSHSILLDSYVVLHAALISSLYKIIGIEFAAHFVQEVVFEYERHHNALSPSQLDTVAGSQPQIQEQDPKGKECSNLMVLLSELYNFQVISSVLVFDLVRQLLQGDITEFDVELLLKLTRNSGQQLRQDDPLALKDIIEIVQKKVAGKADTSLSSRTRFMIETLINLKNNKLKRNVCQNQGGEAVERMKKFLGHLSKRKHVLAHNALRVSLDDLRSAESKGKWWLVGAAWGGNPLVEAQQSMEDMQANGQAITAQGATSDLLKLARKQGMNTDIRRSIFVVLMSSEDYVDACERLSQLNLTELQQREIVRVVLHCCGNEKTYNPYYSLVCQHLCRQSYSYKITLQFCLWDFLRDLGEATVGGAEVVKSARDDISFELKKISSSRMHNVAKAYAWWVTKDVVNLNILKAVDFTVLKATGRNFLQELFLQIYITSQSTTPIMDVSKLPAIRNRSAIEDIFAKAARIENLAMGLVYFLTNSFSNQSYEDEKVANFVKWANERALETLRTGVQV